jgi:hypothetical protein
MSTLNIRWWVLRSTLQKVCINPSISETKLTIDAQEILERAEVLKIQNTQNHEKKIGLVYWKVQSWKTNAMIASTALAFDNGYKISIILTSNNIDLVEQTRDRFQEKVGGSSEIVETYLYQDIKNGNTLSLEALLKDDIRIIIVAWKGSKSLVTVIEFLEKFGTDTQAIIFDDEGDNYSLDNNRKARDDDEDLPPTRINDLIFSRLRNKIWHVMISVTWTPQWVLLEGTNESLGFKYLLEPGSEYVGGETFFAEDTPEDNPYICTFDIDEMEQTLETGLIWNWLRHAIMDFYVVSTLYNIETGKFAELLCHPHQKLETHEVYKNAILGFHNYIVAHITDAHIQKEFEDIFNARKLKTGTVRYFDQLQKYLENNIFKTKVLLKNSGQKDTMTPGRHHIIIGGNILWRWVTIDNLLVMYYSRNAKTTNMDTLYQHARMFWYRRPMLEYMHIYLPEEIYMKFHATYETDESLRDMVRRYPTDTFPITFYDYNTGLRLTRPQIESKDFLSDIFIPRKQFYPNNISEEAFQKNAKVYEDMASEISSMDGQLVDAEDVIKLLERIETTSKNQWKDWKFVAILNGLLENETDKRIRISTNVAERRTWNAKKNGKIETGTLDGTRIDEMRKDEYVNICFSSFAYINRPDLGKMWYPTMVFPEKMDGIGKIYVTKK